MMLPPEDARGTLPQAACAQAVDGPPGSCAQPGRVGPSRGVLEVVVPCCKGDQISLGLVRLFVFRAFSKFPANLSFRGPFSYVKT